MWLTLVAVRNAIAVLMAALAIVVLGATSLNRLSIDLFPNINQPVVTVGTIYTGANVQDIEKTVTYPIEKVVSAVPGVHHVESRSRQGISVVQVWFNYDADLNAGQNDIIQRIQQISNSLPSGIKQPFIIRADLSNIPVCLLTVSGGGFDERQLYDIAYNTIEPQIERINGVAAANVDGGKIRQISVNLNRDLLYAKGISVLDVVRSVNDSNFLMPSGDIKIGTIDYNMFTNNQFQLVKPMEDIIVRKVGDVPVRVRDLGYVQDSSEQQTSVVRVDGGRAVYLRVNKQPSANTIEVVDGVEALLPKLDRRAARREHRPDLRPVDLHPRSRSRASLARGAVQGSLLAFLVILIFLRSVRSTVDHLRRHSAVDHVHASSDVLPRASRSTSSRSVGWRSASADWSTTRSSSWRTSTPPDTPARPRSGAALDAARKCAMPILVSTITTIVVFFPVVFLIGIPKLLFIPLTFTISFSLFCSFFVSRTVTPMWRRCSSPSRRTHDATGSGARSWPGRRGAVRRPRRALPATSFAGPLRHRTHRGLGVTIGAVRGEPRASLRSHRHGLLPGHRREPVPRSRSRRRSAPASRRPRRWSPRSRRPIRAEPPARTNSSPSSSTVGHSRRALRAVQREHRPACGAGAGLPGHARTSGSGATCRS